MDAFAGAVYGGGRMSGEICTDNRFEVIAEAKKRLVEATNIETSAEEMAVIDNILFRFWQMKWLEKILEEPKEAEWKMKPDPFGFFDEIPVCSKCGHTTEMRKTYNFCPNCGARMRKGEDE